MFAMLGASVVTIAQVGSTIGIGLLIDTMVVRTFVVPPIAVLLGRWFSVAASGAGDAGPTDGEHEIGEVWVHRLGLGRGTTDRERIHDGTAIAG